MEIAQAQGSNDFRGRLRNYREESKELRLHEKHFISEFKAGRDVEMNAEFLLISHMGFIIKTATIFGRRHPDMIDDLISEAMEGFMYGLKKFDLSYEVKLLSYVSYWIRAYMTRYLMKNWNRTGIRESDLAKYYFALQKSQRKLIAQGYTGDNLHTEVAKELEISEERLTSLLHIQKRSTSFEDGTTDEGVPLQKAIAAQKTAPPDLFESQRLAKAMLSLTPRERIVIEKTVMCDHTLE